MPSWDGKWSQDRSKKASKKRCKKEGHQDGQKVATRCSNTARPQGSRVQGRSPPLRRDSPLGQSGKNLMREDGIGMVIKSIRNWMDPQDGIDPNNPDAGDRDADVRTPPDEPFQDGEAEDAANDDWEFEEWMNV